MAIQIYTSEAHRGNDLQISAYNTDTNTLSYAFIHKVYNSRYAYESTAMGGSLKIVHSGSLSECVYFTLNMLEKSVATPSPSEKIRDEVEHFVNQRDTLEWNPVPKTNFH